MASSADQLTAIHQGGSSDLGRQAGWFLNEVRVAMVETLAERPT